MGKLFPKSSLLQDCIISFALQGKCGNKEFEFDSLSNLFLPLPSHPKPWKRSGSDSGPDGVMRDVTGEAMTEVNHNGLHVT